MFKRLFSKKSFEEIDDNKDSAQKPPSTQKQLSKQSSGGSPECDYVKDNQQPSTSAADVPTIDINLASAPVGLKKRVPVATSTGSDTTHLNSMERRRKISTAKKKKARKESTTVQINVEKPLDYPCTPELILEYHKRKAFLSRNEEWLLVELNEYECLIESQDIIKVIAKHSKFFEVDPDELWEEFFEFVEEMSCYDDIINYDVWQEFRDKKYLC